MLLFADNINVDEARINADEVWIQQ